MGDQLFIWVGTARDLESQLSSICKYFVWDAFGLKSCAFLRSGLNWVLIAGSPQTTYNNEGDIVGAFNENLSCVY